MSLDILGTAEAARLLGVHKVTISRWIREGTLTPDVRLECGPIFRRATIMRRKQKDSTP